MGTKSKTEPTYFKTETCNAEVKIKKASASLLIPGKQIIERNQESGLKIRNIRTVKDSHWELKGKQLDVEVKLTNPETGEIVDSSEATHVLAHYGNLQVDEAGKEVDPTDVRFFEVLEDGTEDEVEPFRKTRLLEIPKDYWVSSTVLDNYLFESGLYEIFGVDKAANRELFNEAEKRLKQDQVGMCTFSWGNGFNQFYAFLIPVILEGKFVWVMRLTQNEKKHENLQEIPGEIKIPIRKEVRTVQALPPLQVLVVASKKKKQKN